MCTYRDIKIVVTNYTFDNETFEKMQENVGLCGKMPLHYIFSCCHSNLLSSHHSRYRLLTLNISWSDLVGGKQVLPQQFMGWHEMFLMEIS